MRTIEPNELKNEVEGEAPLILSVVAPESGAVVEGGRTASVYEMTFLDNVAKLAGGKSAAIVLHDSGEPHDHASQIAWKKLVDAGYDNVRVLTGGVLAWAEAGGATSGSEPDRPKLEEVEGRFVVDKEKSVIRWTGRNLANYHEGTLNLLGGELALSHGELKSAIFEIDMNSIACADLSDPALNALLITHLKDDDFFGVAEHPTARFAADSATAITARGSSLPNVRIGGKLTLKGVSAPVEFDAAVGLTGADELAAQAFLAIDRTRWGVLYGSSKFFARLGGHLVSDEIQLHLKLTAKRA